jgi:hypothetical protein
MGRIEANIDDKLEKKFRQLILDEYGGKKGAITDAIEDAIMGLIVVYEAKNR